MSILIIFLIKIIAILEKLDNYLIAYLNQKSFIFDYILVIVIENGNVTSNIDFLHKTAIFQLICYIGDIAVQ